VTSLRGETVLYTGTVHVDGAQMERRTLQEQTRLIGGRVAPDQSRAVTVLVLGDLGVGRRLTDPRRGFSRKLVFVEKMMRESGRHIHVIDDLGFGELLHGRPATCRKLRSVGDGLLAEPPEVGV